MKPKSLFSCKLMIYLILTILLQMYLSSCKKTSDTPFIVNPEDYRIKSMHLEGTYKNDYYYFYNSDGSIDSSIIRIKKQDSTPFSTQFIKYTYYPEYYLIDFYDSSNQNLRHYIAYLNDKGLAEEIFLIVQQGNYYKNLKSLSDTNIPYMSYLYDEKEFVIQINDYTYYGDTTVYYKTISGSNVIVDSIYKKNIFSSTINYEYYTDKLNTISSRNRGEIHLGRESYNLVKTSSTQGFSTYYYFEFDDLSRVINQIRKKSNGQIIDEISFQYY